MKGTQYDIAFFSSVGQGSSLYGDFFTEVFFKFRGHGSRSTLTGTSHRPPRQRQQTGRDGSLHSDQGSQRRPGQTELSRKKMIILFAFCNDFLVVFGVILATFGVPGGGCTPSVALT